MAKNQPANTGAKRDASSVPVSGRSPGGGYGNPLQYSCRGNPMNRGGWWAAMHVVAELEVTKLACRHKLRTLTFLLWS